jgi:hypothetical protein
VKRISERCPVRDGPAGWLLPDMIQQGIILTACGVFKRGKSAGKNVSDRTVLLSDDFRLIRVHKHALKLVLVIHP